MLSSNYSSIQVKFPLKISHVMMWKFLWKIWFVGNFTYSKKMWEISENSLCNMYGTMPPCTHRWLEPTTLRIPLHDPTTTLTLLPVNFKICNTWCINTYMYRMYEFMYFYIDKHTYNNCYSINSLVYFFNISADGYILNALKWL